MQGWVDLVSWLHTKMIYSSRAKMIIHPSRNWSQRAVTSLMRRPHYHCAKPPTTSRMYYVSAMMWCVQLMGDEPDLDPEITCEFFENYVLKFDPTLLTESGMKWVSCLVVGFSWSLLSWWGRAYHNSASIITLFWNPVKVYSWTIDVLKGLSHSRFGTLQSHLPSIRNQVVYEERMRTGHLLGC